MYHIFELLSKYLCLNSPLHFSVLFWHVRSWIEKHRNWFISKITCTYNWTFRLKYFIDWILTVETTLKIILTIIICGVCRYMRFLKPEAFQWSPWRDSMRSVNVFFFFRFLQRLYEDIKRFGNPWQGCTDIRGTSGSIKGLGRGCWGLWRRWISLWDWIISAVIIMSAYEENP